MSTIRIGVVADTRRREQAEQLADSVGATVLSFDEGGSLGCNKNHIKVWTKLQQHGGDWLVVLEDDALPVDGFLDQLTAALENPPTDVVSLYLGTGYPKAWQRFVKKAMADTTDSNYVLSSHLLHSVGVAMRLHMVNDMLRFVGWMSAEERKWPIDEQITHWARLRGNRFSYTRPSLVDHADGPTLVSHPDGQSRNGIKRVAWEVGCRDKWDANKTVAMP